MEMNRLLIFTGAGFSRSVSNKLSTTREFCDAIEDLDVGGMLSYIKDLVNSRYGIEDHNLDIEILAKTIRQTIKALDVIMPSERDSLDLFSHYSSANYFETKTRSDLRENLEDILDKIHNMVFDKLRLDVPESSEQKNINNIRSFFKQLSVGHNFNVFSTNYDTLIRKIYTKPNRRYYLKNDIVNVEELLNNGQPFSYVPLKGMIDWRVVQDSNIIQGLVQASNLREIVFMPFDFEATPDQHPHDKFYKKFKEELKISKTLLFIGFSFRDSYINECIKREINGKHNVVVVVKDNLSFKKKIKEEVFSVISSKNFHYIKDGFNPNTQKIILDIIKSW